MQPVEQRDEVEMLSLMLLIRRFEERASQQYQAQKIGGFCHLYIGQEAVVVGAVAATRPDDYIITAYRDHAHALARGTSPEACMAELFGKETGCSGGLGGSMHYFDRKRHMYGGHAIVGAHVPVGVGMAFASKYRKEDRVTLCFFGDGAINQGAFHESLNLAQLWKLPCIYICENNQYGMGTSQKRAIRTERGCRNGRAQGAQLGLELLDAPLEMAHVDRHVVEDHRWCIGSGAGGGVILRGAKAGQRVGARAEAAAGVTRPLPADFRIGNRLVCPGLNRIETPDATLQLEPKVMQVLLRMVDRPGGVVTKEELFRALAAVARTHLLVPSGDVRALADALIERAGTSVDFVTAAMKPLIGEIARRIIRTARHR